MPQHLLVLTQLMLTLGIPYIAIYIQFLDPYTMLIVVPVAMALTAVLMFLLVAVIDELTDRPESSNETMLKQQLTSINTDYWAPVSFSRRYTIALQ
ncbi:unnamed protein product [Echinostoma caproni]|uniref:Transmembrane protein n=1 Tax=Echinostoma caproni TaxID=27848 RepID=A0A183AUA0_9TREM|nr:unnamed protein product [Echinostoma caproni]